LLGVFVPLFALSLFLSAHGLPIAQMDCSVYAALRVTHARLWLR
jgi:hypothetical protein